MGGNDWISSDYVIMHRVFQGLMVQACRERDTPCPTRLDTRVKKWGAVSCNPAPIRFYADALLQCTVHRGVGISSSLIMVGT